MPLDKDKCAQLPEGIKYIFDEISAELSGAFRRINTIEKGTTRAEAQNLAHSAGRRIRRAGKICAVCGIEAKHDWKDVE